MRLHSAAMIALVLAAPLRAETLADAIALAYRANPSIQGSRYDLRALNERVVQARSELRPSATFEATGGYDRTVLGDTASAASVGPTAYGRPRNSAEVVLDQPIYTGGRASADRLAAEAGVRAGRETLRITEGDLLLGVVSAYADVRRFQRAREVWSLSVAVLEKLGREIEARRIAGEVTLTDAAQADAQLQIARQQVAATELDLENARADYAALVGRYPGTLAPEPPLPHLPADAEAAFDLAEAQNPELAQARYTEASSRETIAATRAQGLPTVSLRGTAQLTGDNYPYRLRDQDQGFSGSVVLSVPLSQGGRIASQVREAEDRNGSDRFRIELARRTLMRDVAQAWNRIATADRTLDLLSAQHRAAATQLDGMLNEYRVGLRSTFDVLYAQQSLRDVEVAILASTRERYVAQATLLRRAGLLEARALLTGQPLHDAAGDYDRVARLNAVPWEGALAALDRAAGARPRQRTLAQPALATAPAVAAPMRAATPLALVRSAPIVPISGTVGLPGNLR